MFLNSKWMKITLSALFSLSSYFICCGSRIFAFIPRQPIRASFAAGFGVFPTQPVRAICCRHRILHLFQNSLFELVCCRLRVFSSKPVRAFCCRPRTLRFLPKTVRWSYFAAGSGFFPSKPVRAFLLQA